jgi:hypothetical protein
VPFRSAASVPGVPVPRIAFLTALVMSAALFAYSLAGIAGAGGDLSSSTAKPVERSPVSSDYCPDEREGAVRL